MRGSNVSGDDVIKSFVQMLVVVIIALVVLIVKRIIIEKVIIKSKKSCIHIIKCILVNGFKFKIY